MLVRLEYVRTQVQISIEITLRTYARFLQLKNNQGERERENTRFNNLNGQNYTKWFVCDLKCEE